MYHILIIVVEAVVMLFELRFLMQTSRADYYNPLTQAVVKLTRPLADLKAISSIHLGRFYIGSLVVAWAISMIFWILTGLHIHMPLGICAVLGLLMPLKVLGYMLFILLLAQALTSWLPSTRSWSWYMSQLTAPVVAPVQRIIPPIGMIDISLMIVLLIMYAINGLFYHIFGWLWAIV